MRTPKLDEEAFTKAALDYLGRFAASRQSLRAVLLRRIARAARVTEVDRAAAEQAVEVVLDKMSRAGYLNDQQFAEMKAASLRRRGASAQQVRFKLRQKGLEAGLVETMLDASPAAERRAALRYAHRRRLGPYAPSGLTAEQRTRQLAALARAGFSPAVAGWVMSGESVAALERVLQDLEGDSSASISSSEKPK